MASSTAVTGPFAVVAVGIAIVAVTVGVLVAVLAPLEEELWTGTSGPDDWTGTAIDDDFEGRAGDDRIRTLGGPDYLDGGSGDDKLLGGEGGDTYVGGTGDDYAFDDGIDAGLDIFRGGSGDDLLIDQHGTTSMDDGDGRDVLRAGDFRDYLLLTDGADRAWGGAGDDSLQVDPDGEVDVVSCGPGDDTVRFTRREPADRYQGCERFIVTSSRLGLPDG